MKPITATLVLCLAAIAAWAQNPDIIDNTRNTLHAVEQKKTMDINNTLASSPTASKPASAPSSSMMAKPAPVAVKPAVKPAVVAATPAKPVVAKPKPAATHLTTAPAAKPAKKKVMAERKPAKPKEQIAVEDKKNPAEPKKVAKEINLTGRRDPFISPVVSRSMTGSGCATGKRCLAIDQISLKGVVRSDNGMIAVVVNALDKAYFLHENDPVFNGFVTKITGDSITFKENMQDRLGKPFTREVTKRISTPAV